MSATWFGRGRHERRAFARGSRSAEVDGLTAALSIGERRGVLRDWVRADLDSFAHWRQPDQALA